MIRTSLIITILSFLCGLISFANQIIIAKLFGASAQLDAYLIAVSAPLMLVGILTGIFTFSLIPIQVSYRNDILFYGNFSGLLFIIFLGLSVAIALIGYIIAPTFIQLFAPQLSEPYQSQAIYMNRICWFTAGSSAMMSYFVSMHNAARKFILPIIGNIFPYIGMIVTSLLWGSLIGTTTLAWGMFAGSVLSIIILYPSISRDINILHVCFSLLPKVFGIFKKLPLVLLSMLCFTVYGIIDAFWAVRLGPGNVSYLGYNQRLLIGLGNLVIAGPAIVLLPYLSEKFISGDYKHFHTYVRQSLRMVLLLSASIAIIVSMLAVPVIELLFQRGEFDSSATYGVTNILPFMMIGMVAMLEVVIIFKILYSKGDFYRAAILGVIATITYFLLSGVLSKFWGLKGIGVAYAVSWWAVFSVSMSFIYKGQLQNLCNRENFSFLRDLIITLVILGVSALLCKHSLIKPIAEVGAFHLSLQLLATFTICVGGFFITTFSILKMQEVKIIIYSLFHREVSS